MRRKSDILVSACLIIRDEEEFLEDCLRSTVGFAGEIIINDTGSRDRSIEIAKSFGAIVFEEPFRADFSHHRNLTIDRASGDWMFFIDGDEQIVDTDLGETLWYLANSELPPVLLVSTLLRYPGGREVRLFQPKLVRRDSGIRYVHPIHEQLDVEDCPAMVSNVKIVHHGYATPEAQLRKETRNLEIARRMPDSPHALHCRARSCLSLKRWEELREAADALYRATDSNLLRLEACVFGAAAAYNLDNAEALEEWVRRGHEVAPGTPDILFVELIAAASRYLKSVETGDSLVEGDFLRPWIFWHDREQIRLLVEVLTGMRRIVSRDEKGSLQVEDVRKWGSPQ